MHQMSYAWMSPKRGHASLARTALHAQTRPVPRLIHTYALVLGRPPAEADLQRYFCVSPPSVHQMVLTLERAGLIERHPRVARSIKVLVDPTALPPLCPTAEQTVKSSVRRY